MKKLALYRTLQGEHILCGVESTLYEMSPSGNDECELAIMILRILADVYISSFVLII